MRRILCNTFLVLRSGAHGRSIHINTGLLPHVDPDDGTLLGVALGHSLENVLKALLCRLTAAVDLKDCSVSLINSQGILLGSYFTHNVRHC